MRRDWMRIFNPLFIEALFFLVKPQETHTTDVTVCTFE